MSLKLYNSLSRTKEPFTPLKPGEVSLYVCGVTVYDDAHIGHLRPAVVFDALSRYWRRQGLKVQLVVNFTDIDDKIIHRANQEQREWDEVSEEFIQKYTRDLEAFGLDPVLARPRASQHIQDMESMIKRLEERGFAYRDDFGNVWFEVHAFKKYGALSNRTLDKLMENVEGETVTPTAGFDSTKRDVLDFCLWKSAKAGEPSFHSDFGPGRPGWHIECSAMIHALFQETIDIHAGGLDLIFPHHENEIAQSEAAFDHPLARHWMHIGLVTLKGEKMSKSLGNVVTIKNLIERHPKNALLYFYHSCHYRSPLEYSEEKLRECEKAMQRVLHQFNELGRLLADPATLLPGGTPLLANSEIERYESIYRTAIEDDFNFPKLLGHVFSLVKKGHFFVSGGKKITPADADILRRFVAGTTDYLGLLGFDPRVETGDLAPVTADATVTASLLDLLLEVRQEVRERKLYALGDKIRDQLQELGFAIKDGPEGSRWFRRDDG